MRARAIGQPCTFRVEGVLAGAGPGGRERAFGSVFLGPAAENAALAVVSAGWARLKTGGGAPGGPPPSPYLAELTATAEAAESAGRGVWGAAVGGAKGGAAPAPAPPAGDALLAALGGKGAAVPAVVEHVASGSALRVSFTDGHAALLPPGRSVSVLLAGAQAPSMPRPAAAEGGGSNGTEAAALAKAAAAAKAALAGGLPAPPPTAAAVAAAAAPSTPAQPGAAFAPVALHFAATRALHRDVLLTLAGADRHGNLVGSVAFPPAPGAPPSVDLAGALVAAGLARTAEWGLQMLAPAAAAALRAAERAAKQAGVALWKGWAPPPSAGTRSSGSWAGPVVEIISGDCLAVLDPGSGVERRVFLSSIRAPRPGRGGGVGAEPWGVEAREFLRARLAGKVVSVRLEYERAVGVGGGTPAAAPPGGAAGKAAAPAAPPPRPMAFACVTLPPPPSAPPGTPPANVGELLLSRGLASTVRHRADDERAAGYEGLLAAEAGAAASKKGLHNPAKPPPTRHCNDLSAPGTAARARTHLPFLTRGGAPLAGVVEHVSSGHRARVYIPKEGVMLAFSPAGVRAPAPPRPGGEQPSEPGGEDALLAVRRAVLHRDVSLSVEGVDRGGTFLGALTVPGTGWEWGPGLLGAGLGRLLPPAGGREVDASLAAAEAGAKAARKGVWKDWDAAAEAAAAAAAEAAAAAGEAASTAPATWRPAALTVSDARGPLDFSVQLACSGGEGHGGEVAAAGGDPASRVAWVTAQLAEADLASGPPLPGPALPPPGTLLAAPFSGDGLYYRARLDRRPAAGATAVPVTFVDFGNEAAGVSVPALRALSPELAAIPPLASPASLAFLRLPDGPQAHLATEAAAVFVEAVGSGASVGAAVVGRSSGGAGAVAAPAGWGGAAKKAAPPPATPARLALLLGTELATKGAPPSLDPARSVNAALLRAGLARFAPPPGPPPPAGSPLAAALDALAAAEADARRRHEGMWEFGDPGEGDDEDDGGMSLRVGGGGRGR